MVIGFSYIVGKSVSPYVLGFVTRHNRGWGFGNGRLVGWLPGLLSYVCSSLVTVW